MIRIRKYNLSKKSEGINISPLIDMVFILLIFFVVTAGFVKETGVEINKPSAKSVKKIDNNNIFLTISENGKLYIKNRQLDIDSLQLEIKKQLAQNSNQEIIIIADQNTKTGLLIKAIDKCKLAGAKDISIAAEDEK